LRSWISSTISAEAVTQVDPVYSVSVVLSVVVLPCVVVETWVGIVVLSEGVVELPCVGVKVDEAGEVVSGSGVLPGVVVETVSITGVVELPCVGVEVDEAGVVVSGSGVLPGVVGVDQ